MIVLSFVLVQCKKLDLRHTPDLQQTEADSLPPVLKKFFDTSKVSSPVITSIARKIYRQEKGKPFIEKFVKYAGYPVWDKSLSVNVRSSLNVATRGSNNSSGTVVMIPFSLRNDSTVNAILKVSLTKKDTTFRMLYRWQYKRNGYENKDSVNNADRTALFFMGMESQAFGHQYYKINDSLLFPDDSVAAHYLRINGFNGTKMDGLMERITVEICYTYYESEAHGQVIGVPPGGSIDYEEVTDCEYYTVWVESGGGSGTGDSPPVDPGTSGGGDGSDSGGWEENPCGGLGGGGNTPSTRFQDPCDDPPAWEPVEELPVLEDQTLIPPFVWKYNGEIGDVIEDEYPSNKPSFQFLSSDNYETKYPQFTELVKNLKSLVMSNHKVLSALEKWSGLSQKTIIDYLSFGQGPIIKIIPMTGSLGYFNGKENPAILNIRDYYVNILEATPSSYVRESMAFLLSVTVLHEFVHFGNYINGNSEGAYEFGTGFEIEAFNVIVSTDNAGKLSINFMKYY